MSKYACTPSDALPYSPPTGFVVDVTPLTRISVAVTPGESTGGKLPPLIDVALPPLVCGVARASAALVVPPLEFEQAAAARATAATVAVQRARIGRTPRSCYAHRSR